jgi:hypothetical protein
MLVVRPGRVGHGQIMSQIVKGRDDAGSAMEYQT